MPGRSLEELLAAFRARHPMRPCARPIEPGEDTQLEEGDGLFELLGPPASGVARGSPPRTRSDAVATYLWVLDATGIRVIIEAPTRTLDGARPKHSNLTAGNPAYVGGEIWFASEGKLYISGGSGRYPPIDGSQLEEVATILRTAGYEVVCLGWDEETGSARRLLLEELEP